MTAQFPDRVHYRDRYYSVTSLEGMSPPFEPEGLGMIPFSTCTACWRGYICTYAVRNKTLILESLDINLKDENDEPLSPSSAPLINGKAPADNGRGKEDYRQSIFSTQYRDLELALNYTGTIEIADKFIDELYVHMGFHPSWKYEEVHELNFDGGKLVSERDCSAEMAEMRKRMGELPEPKPPPGIKPE